MVRFPDCFADADSALRAGAAERLGSGWEWCARAGGDAGRFVMRLTRARGGESASDLGTRGITCSRGAADGCCGPAGADR